MTPLSDALVAAQRRALAALEKAYVAEALDAETVIERAKAFGISDPVDLAALLAALDVLREWGAALPAETNGATSDPATEKMSDRQAGFIRQLCREKNLPEPESFDTLTKANASEAINDLQAGNYDPAKWRVPF